MNATRPIADAGTTPFPDAARERWPSPHVTRPRRTDVSALSRRAAPATCGELMQGAVDGHDFLVNCPVDRFATATVRRVERPGLHVRRPEAFAKVRDALALLDPPPCGRAGHDGLEVEIAGDLPRGKGMASSSAELAAALSAVGAATGRPLHPAALSALIARVEPSDSVHLPGIAHANHLTGRLETILPAPRGLDVVVVDCGGEIDTVAFDRERARAIYREERETVLAALTHLVRGLRGADLEAVGRAATASAELNQRILPKPAFEELLAVARLHGALGTSCAHSGTVLGVLHRRDARTAERLQHDIAHRFGDAARVLGVHRVIGGGCRGR